MNKGEIAERPLMGSSPESSLMDKEMKKAQNDQNLISTEWPLLYNKFFAGPPDSDFRNEIEYKAAPSAGTKKYHISDLVDIGLIHKLLYQCNVITGVPNALLDVDNNILSATGWQEICIKFHRACPQTESRCRQSDSNIFNNLRAGSYIGYKCLNGFSDYGVPIIVEGQHLASILAGQCLHEPPDMEFFHQQARQYGFDEDAYMKALKKVPIIAEDRLKDIMEFYSQLVQVVATMGMERLRQLEVAEDKFFKAFHCSPDPITITTLEGRYVELNDAWVRITGYERQEAIGHSAVEMGIWLSQEERNSMLKRIHEQGSIRSVETRFRTKGGKIRTYLVSADILNIDNEPHLLCVHKDITERKQIEEKLRWSEERFSKAFNASPTVMCITTLDEEVLFIDVNDYFCSIFGVRREQVLGKTIFELGFWLDPNDWKQIGTMIRKKQTVRNMEIHFSHQNQEHRLGLYAAERIDIGGQACALSIMIDITESRQMEHELNRLDRLNLVGEMAASIGHEIRNPMTTVRGFLQMLKSQGKYMDDSETFDLMIDELDRANGIITEYLSLAKHKLIKLELVDLNLTISHMMPLFQVHATAQDKSIKLEEGEITDLLLDEKEIRQLLLNLVRNGLEAMPARGTLTIKTSKIDQKIRLSIQDEGEGIPPKVLEKLGTPFFSTKEKGTGLGLAVCYGIAKRHNASITIETNFKGTTFHVDFPGLP